MTLRILVVLVTTVVGAAAGPAMAAPPANDTSAAATVIGTLPYDAEVDTTEATIGDDDRAIGCGIDPTTQTFSHSVWFAYTPPEDQTIVIGTGESSYPVAGAVFPAGAPEAPLACFLGSTIVTLTGGTTYLIDLLEIGDAAGGGTLRLSVTEADIPEPELTLEPIGRVDRAGTATLEGTLTCDPGSFPSLTASFTQVIGRRTAVSGFGELFGEEIVCDGTPQTWSVSLTPFQGRFTPGPGSVTVSLSECRDFCGFAEVTASVVLRRAGRE